MVQEGFALVGACHRVGPMGWERGESLASGTGDNCISFREIQFSSVNKFTLGEKKGQEESQSCIWRDCRHLRNGPLSGRVLALPLCMSPRTTKSSPLHCSQLKGYNKRPQATAITCQCSFTLLTASADPSALSLLLEHGQHSCCSPSRPHRARVHTLGAKCYYSMSLLLPTYLHLFQRHFQSS